MKKLKFYILLVVLLFIFSTLNAQGKYHIKIGANYSTFNVADENPKPGILLGIGKEWRIFRNTYITGGIQYSVQKSTLNNKTIKPGGWEGYNIYVPRLNLKYSVGYLEIPFCIKQYFPFCSRHISFFIDAGIILNIYANDMSEKEYLGDISIEDLSEEEREEYNFDFRYTSYAENYSYCGSGLYPSAGFGFVWSCYQIEFKYQKKHIFWANYIYIDKYLKSYSVNFIVNFKLFNHSGASNENE